MPTVLSRLAGVGEGIEPGGEFVYLEGEGVRQGWGRGGVGGGCGGLRCEVGG